MNRNEGLPEENSHHHKKSSKSYLSMLLLRLFRAERRAKLPHWVILQETRLEKN